MDVPIDLAGIAIVLLTVLHTKHRMRQAERAHARAMAEAARRAKWTLRKVVFAAVLIATMWILLLIHAR